ncbi:MAG: imidazoleglycerol-phosphate dehydratase [Gemmatimonadota bacterium]
MKSYRRETRETRVALALAAGEGPIAVETGEKFLDHMLLTLAQYAGVQLRVEATGDLRHHLIEDVAITVGLALKDLVPAACSRYGHSTIPMDEALVEVALDVGGRACYEGRLPSSLYEHFLRSLAQNAAMTLHVRVLRGRDRHHIVEAAFKATGLALRQALTRSADVFSTKGAIIMEQEG